MSDEQPTYHITDYIAWRNGGRTECCSRPVRELPASDVCGQRPRDEGTRYCIGPTPTDVNSTEKTATVWARSSTWRVAHLLSQRDYDLAAADPGGEGWEFETACKRIVGYFGIDSEITEKCSTCAKREVSP